MNDTSLNPPVAPRLSSSWQPWTLLVPAGLILPLLSLAYSLQITPAAEKSLTVKGRRGHSKPSHAPNKTVAQVPSKVFLPGSDELLHTQPVPANRPNPGISTDAQFIEDAKTSLTALFNANNAYLPKNAQVAALTFVTAGSSHEPATANLALNEAFWQPEFWTMDSRARLAVQAIVQTVASSWANSGHHGAIRVKLLRPGHETLALGQLDVSDAIDPDATVVAAH